MTKADYARALEEHYAELWSAPLDAARWDRGPIGELPSDFRILKYQRNPRMAAYATRGMSQLADEERLELHLLSRPSPAMEPELVELLTVTAHYHRTGSRLALGHTVSFGRPWLDGSSCTHGLISLPYLDGPRLEWLATPRARFWWLIPITASELQFKKSHGLEALEQRFDASAVDFLDPLRTSVV